MRTLFVIGLPRSLTTLVHSCAAQSLGLRQPRWTSAGEVLNAERITFTKGMRGDGLRYTLPSETFRIEQLHCWLTDCVPATGCAVKDVVQPFAAASWLAGRPDIAILHVERSPGAVAWSMLRAGWRFPERAGAGTGRDALLLGLMRAQEALREVAEVTLCARDLLHTEDPLARALAELYPGQPARVPRYIDDGFVRRREQFYRDSESGDWLSLCTRVQQLNPQISRSIR